MAWPECELVDRRGRVSSGLCLLPLGLFGSLLAVLGSAVHGPAVLSLNALDLVTVLW